MDITPANEVTDALSVLWHQALDELMKKRGGEALLDSLKHGHGRDEQLSSAVILREVWIARDGDRHAGFALMSDRVIQGIFVDRAHRRHGIARAILTVLLETDRPPVDALALPGDRATKSLYESVGWKARLLTMRGE